MDPRQIHKSSTLSRVVPIVPYATEKPLRQHHAFFWGGNSTESEGTLPSHSAGLTSAATTFTRLSLLLNKQNADSDSRPDWVGCAKTAAVDLWSWLRWRSYIENNSLPMPVYACHLQLLSVPHSALEELCNKDFSCFEQGSLWDTVDQRVWNPINHIATEMPLLERSPQALCQHMPETQRRTFERMSSTSEAVAVLFQLALSKEHFIHY